jgi:hypothetical protein
MSENNWKPGDIGICVNTGLLPHQTNSTNLPPLRLKAEYLVQNVSTCGCGSVMLDVGFGLTGDKGVNCGCGARTSPATGIRWISAQRLVKKQTNQEVEEQIEQAVLAEDYELAQELTDKLNK